MLPIRWWLLSRKILFEAEIAKMWIHERRLVIESQVLKNSSWVAKSITVPTTTAESKRVRKLKYQFCQKKKEWNFNWTHSTLSNHSNLNKSKEQEYGMYLSPLLLSASASTSTSTKRHSYARLSLGSASHPTCLVYSFGSLASKGKLRHHAICKDFMILTRSFRITLPCNRMTCPARSYHHRQESYHASPYHRSRLFFHFHLKRKPPNAACLSA